MGVGSPLSTMISRASSGAASFELSPEQRAARSGYLRSRAGMVKNSQGFLLSGSPAPYGGESLEPAGEVFVHRVAALDDGRREEYPHRALNLFHHVFLHLPSVTRSRPYFHRPPGGYERELCGLDRSRVA